MLSKNNRNELFRKQEPKKQRFTIKKLTVGVASVLIGFTFMGMSVSANTDAEGTANTTPTAQTANANSGQNSTDATNGASDTQTNKQTGTTPTADNSQGTSTGVAASQQGNANSGQSGQTNGLIQPTGAQINPESEGETSEVSDWQDFVTAMNNSNVTTIKLTHDITVTNSANGLSQPNPTVNSSKLELTGKNISRTLTIDGQGQYGFDFGQYYLSFLNKNENADSPWNITFKDLKINADGRDNSYAIYGGAFSPFYMGDDLSDSYANASSVTFDGVTADVKNGGFWVTGMDNNVSYIGRGTVTFTGTNNITCDNINVKGNQLYNYSSAITAAKVIFASGTNTTINGGTAKTNNSTNKGGNLIRTSNNTGSEVTAVDIEKGATVTLNGTSADVRGIMAGNGINSDVQVDGTLNANMANGHSTVIFANNLNVGTTGVIDINTKQDNNGNNSTVNAEADFDGTHYGVIALGAGYPANVTASSSGSTSLTDNGSIKIVRNAGTVLAPVVTFGNGGVNQNGKYTLTIGNGATFDLQDNSKTDVKGTYTNTPYTGMVTMWGTSSVDNINITTPKYVNLQRTGSMTGDLIHLEGTTNSFKVNGVTPLAQWDEANTSSTPTYYWSISNLSGMNNWGTHANSGFTASGKTSPVNADGQEKFMHSNGTVDLAKNQAGEGSSSFSNGTTATTTTGVSYQTPYLNTFLNNFSWWKPQRIAMGSALEANGVTTTDADKYQPEAQTINTNKGTALSALDEKEGIKDLINADGTTTSPTGIVDWTKSHWFNATTDGTAWNNTMKDADGTAMAQPTNPTTINEDTSAWATITYTDGSTDFVKIPIHVNSLADQYAPEGGQITVDENHTLTPTDAENAITNKSSLVDSNNKSVVNTTDGYTWATTPSTTTPGAKSGTVKVTYTDGSSDVVPVVVNVQSQADQYTPTGKDLTTTVGTVPSAEDGIANQSDLPTGTTYTWSTAPDVSKAGTVPGVIKVTYPDKSVDEVPVNVTVGTPAISTTTNDADKNAPTGKDVTTTIGVLPDPSTAVNWPAGQPTGGTPTYAWSQTPDVYTKGDHPAVVQVTYPDGSVDYVPTTVTVTNAPTGKTVTMPKGTTPDASTTIDWGNGSEPTGTTVTWEQEPDVANPGTTTGTAKITYPTGETTTVPVQVVVTDPSATDTSFNPYGTTINMDYGHTPTDTDAQNAIVSSSIPSDATDVTYKWATTPDTTKSGIQQDYVTVTGTINGKQVSKTVPVYVNVGKQADNYQPEGKNLTVQKGDPVPDASTAISNKDALPKGTKYTWALAPNTNTAGTQSDLVKVTYPDSSVDYVPVNVTVKDHVLDSEKYPVTYPGMSINRPSGNTPASQTVGPKLTDNMPAGTITGYTKDNSYTAPDGVTVSVDPNTGKVTVEATKDAKLGTFGVPVVVTYKDNTTANPDTATVYVPVTIKDDDQVVIYGDNTTTVYTLSDYTSHKTNDGSGHTPVAMPVVKQIEYRNNDQHWNITSSVTYKLNAAGTEYVSNDYSGIKMHQYYDAPASFAASDIKVTGWREGMTPNSDVSNFPETKTGTSTVEQTIAEAPNGDQRRTDNGYLKTQVNFTVDPSLKNYLDYSNPGQSNVLGNIYGATTGEALTFKQNADISNLTQDQYRQLINVTDLGQGGWNGTNVNPDSPIVSAIYTPGTDSTRTFYMTWAPNGQPSTATVANGVAGTVRIHFNDGTWLDIPAQINVEAASTNPDNQTFSQKIVYTYNGQEVGYTTIGDIAKGGSLTADQLKNAIDNNVPDDYSIQSGYTYPAAENNITATPDVINVPLTLKSGVNMNLTGKLVYKKADGTNFANGQASIDGAQTIKSKQGDVLPAGLLKDYADQGMSSIAALKGYKISQYPASYQVENDGFTITVLVEDATKTVTPGGTDPTDPSKTIDPSNPAYKDLFTTSTRTIHITDPDGTTRDVQQVIHYGRTGVLDEVTGKFVDGQFGDYYVYNTTTNKLTSDKTGIWDAYDVAKDNYDAYIDNVKSSNNKVAEEDNVAADTNKTVNVTYKDATKTVTPGNPGVTPDSPDYNQLFHKVIRTIIVNNPVTGLPETHLQTVTFGRTGTYDEATQSFTSDGYGDWHVYTNGALTNESTGSWPEFTAPAFSGYTPSQAEVAAQSVTADTQDTTVTINYSKNNNGDHGNGGKTTPGDHGNGSKTTPGDHGNGGKTTPGDHGNSGTTTPDDHGNGGNTNPGTTNGGNGNGQTINGNNGNGNGQAAINVGNTSSTTSQGQQSANRLPQTGNADHSAAIAGLSIAGLTAMLGLIGGRKKKED